MEKKIAALSFLVGNVVGDNHIDDAWLGKGTHGQHRDNLERIPANVHDRMHGHGRIHISGAHNGRIVESSARTGGGARAGDNDARAGDNDARGVDDADVDMDDGAAAADALLL